MALCKRAGNVGVMVLGVAALVLSATKAPGQEGGWEKRLARDLPLLGHRNWIVIADSAYPLQSGVGIETMATGADQLKVVQAVLDALGKCKHVRPIIYLDAELPFVPESDAPGISAYRDALKTLLKDRKSTACRTKRSSASWTRPAKPFMSSS